MISREDGMWGEDGGEEDARGEEVLVSGAAGGQSGRDVSVPITGLSG